ncbi:hypothetical protein [Brevundimonas nasdae]|uniref:DUF2946 domain-containing protein n=1 Tax=Brevundimonas nasdae TaxID=172043 RepID=A0ABX8TDG9_9CAUL|nr:hypothetical protein [Brevundimonas nasdae]QYC09233.1 hypothetical protein KWG56_11480 [Brevundimonas nasdae]QYC15282.1 hypothetical protein KWG63_06810 [Brevundimonas nasdae]
MKSVRRHMIALAGAALAVFAMFMVSTVSFAAPAFASTPVTSADCADMDMGAPRDQAPNKGVLLCAKDCAVICHALLTPPVTAGKITTFAPVAYLTHHPRLTSVVVDRDDPPPR